MAVRSFFILALFVFFWMNLPKKMCEKLRSFATTCFEIDSQEDRGENFERLQIENGQLRTQMRDAREWLIFDRHIQQNLKAFETMKDESYLKRRTEYLQDLLAREIFSIPARVTYRDPSSWSSTLWINKGAFDNRALKKVVIAKNSPVLAEGSLVGVIDYVGEKQSRVRLITDSGLCPSVRVLRNGLQNREISQQLQILLEQIKMRDDLFESVFEKEHLITSLLDLSKRIGFDWNDGYLAKGELCGSSAALWRSRTPILKGVGFNYDYPDEEGGPLNLQDKTLLIKEGDLLVTSGLDGVFPMGLPVGRVIQTSDLKQGDYAIEIQVRPCVSSFNDLQTLFILQPIE